MELTKDWVQLGRTQWVLDELDENSNPRDFYLSYNSNDIGLGYFTLDSDNPETAIVIRNDKGPDRHRYLIYRNDWREELEAIYPDLDKLKAHWKEFGGHFWSDKLED